MRRDDLLFLNAELTPAERRAVQRRVKAGELHRISPGIATALPAEEWPALIQREKTRILAALFPGAVVGYKSAFDAMQGPVMHLAYTYSRAVELPGLKVELVKAPPRLEGDQPISGRDIYFPGHPRIFLDNMTRSKTGRTASRAQLEQRLLSIAEAQGDEKLSDLRLQIEALAPAMGRAREAKALGKIIGALLGTQSPKSLKSPAGRARSLGHDAACVARLDALVNALRKTPMPVVKDVATTAAARQNFAFLESYFSNFIEGTEFEIEEARSIVMEGRIVENRPRDSHDILGVYRQASHPGWRMQPLAASDGILVQLQERHADMMGARPEVSPGQFKLVKNRAGTTLFVEPGLVRGTLVEGAKRLNDVEQGLPRALAAMLLVADVHPFVDGNGRLARLMMNAELSYANQCRIIVPTLYRESYLDCLRAMTRESDAALYSKAMMWIRDWTGSFDYGDADKTIETMRRCNAFERSPANHRLLQPNKLNAA